MSTGPGCPKQTRTAGEAAGFPVAPVLRRCLLAALLVGAGTGAWAQADQMPAERARIAAERGRIAERVTAEQRACHQRFAVNDCLKASRATERAELDVLRRQEIALNDSERKRKAAEQLDKLDEKRQTQETDRATRATAPPSIPQSPPRPAGGRLPGTAAPRQPDTQQIQAHEEAMRRKQERHVQDNAHRAEQAAKAGEEARRFDARQREAAEYKARVQQRNAGKPSTAQPLPAP